MVSGSSLHFFLMWVLCSLLSHQIGVDAQPMVVLTLPATLINEGDDVRLQCDATNLQVGYYIEWVRRGPSEAEDAIIASNGVSLESRISMEVLPSAAQSRSERITISNIDKMENSYECRVEDAGGNQLVNSIVAFQVMFFPDDMYPVCTPAGEFTVETGTTQTISCTTERSNPASQMAITTTGDDDVVSDWTFTEDAVTYEGKYSKEQTWTENVRFKCIISSTAFPNRESSCVIGPVTVTGGNTVGGDMTTRLAAMPGTTPNTSPDTTPNALPVTTPNTIPVTTPEVAATPTMPSSAPDMVSKFNPLTLLITSFSLIIIGLLH